MSLPSTQQAIATPAKRAPLVNVTVPIDPPSAGEVVIHTAWTSSTPLDLHRADGGAYIASYPFLLGGGGVAGKVVAVGSGGDLKGLQVGDRVMAFAFGDPKRANHKPYITTPAHLVSKIPAGISDEEAVTVPVNLATVFHTATKNLGLDLPWPIPEGYKPEHADKAILIWGAGSSVGIFSLQIFKHWGYRNLIAVASGKHHEYLKSLGAAVCFDYSKPDVVETIKKQLATEKAPRLPYIIDCIGSIDGTLKPISKIAESGSTVAIMLPVIVKNATEEEEPIYLLEADETNCLPGEWAENTVVQGVRTHFYEENQFWKEHLQPEIIPALLKDGVVKPNNFRVVEGDTALQRAQNALSLLRSRAVSGERLVWRVADE